MQFLRVGYLRQLQKEGGILPAGQCCPPEGVHVGAPPNGAEIFYVIYLMCAHSHPDPYGDHLDALVSLLDRIEDDHPLADDSDLVSILFCATPQYHYNALVGQPPLVRGDQRLQELERIRNPAAAWRSQRSLGKVEGAEGSGDLTEDQRRWRDEVEREYGFRLATYCAIRTIVLHRVPNSSVLKKLLWESAWCMSELTIAAYCERIVNANDEEVKRHIRADMLSNPVRSLRDGIKDGKLKLTFPADVEEKIIPMMRDSLSALVPVREDEVGFNSFCDASQISWVRVRYLRHVAASGTLLLRRQELPRGTFIVGAPPQGRTRYVVSHGWATENHPTPTGARIAQLVAALDKAGATDDDLVFMDFLSLYQRARSTPPGMPPQCERTPREKKLFGIALWEMSRMYAFRGCQVIVLPQIEVLPASSEIKSKYSDVKGRECQWSATWGWINTVPYANRGWCAAEFACARKAGIIANKDDPHVVEVLNSRSHCGGWPETVEDYQRMMEDESIEFTSRGDRDHVAYIFFKMSFDLREAVRESEQEVNIAA